MKNAASSGAQADNSGANAVKREVKTTHIVPEQRFVVAMALSMAWQLALVVIVPIVGGYMLDQHYHKSPILTLAGLVVALVGVFGVLSKIAIDAGRNEDGGTSGGAA